MPYDPTAYSSWTPSKGMVQPGQHTYNGLIPSDDLAEIKSSNYFLPLRRDQKLQIDDVFYIIGTDGNDFVKVDNLFPEVTVSKFIVPFIPDGFITNAMLADNSVTSPKIQEGQVMSADIANLAVTNQKYGTSSITGNKLQDGIIDATKLANNTVSVSKITTHSGFSGNSSPGIRIEYTFEASNNFTLITKSNITNSIDIKDF